MKLTERDFDIISAFAEGWDDGRMPLPVHISYDDVAKLLNKLEIELPFHLKLIMEYKLQGDQ